MGLGRRLSTGSLGSHTQSQTPSQNKGFFSSLLSLSSMNSSRYKHAGDWDHDSSREADHSYDYSEYEDEQQNAAAGLGPPPKLFGAGGLLSARRKYFLKQSMAEQEAARE